MYLDWYDISETKWGSSDTGGEAEVVTCTLRAVGESEGQVELAADVWGAYGLSYRPASPKDGAVCQAVCYTAGGKRHVIATRDTRGGEIHGALNDGDMCMWSVGKNMLRCNADGAIAMIQRGLTDDARLDARVGIEPDGTIVLSNEFGQAELGANGFVVTLASGEQFQIGPGVFNVGAPTISLKGAASIGVAPVNPVAAIIAGSPAPFPGLLVG